MKVNVQFGVPDPMYHLELDAQSLAAYTNWVESGRTDIYLYEIFLSELHKQLQPQMGSRGYIFEVWPDVGL